jgi:hypothetical protein
MATTQEDIRTEKEERPSKPQSNSESIDRKRSSTNDNVDNGENQVSNGTQSLPPQPGIAKVGNTGAESTES